MNPDDDVRLAGQLAALEFAIVEIARALKANGSADIAGAMRKAVAGARREGAAGKVKEHCILTLTRLAAECERR